MSRVLIVTETAGFLIQSLREQLEEKRFEAAVAKIEINSINDELAGTDLILVNVSDSLQTYKQALVYLRDRAIGEDIPVFLLGDHHDVDEVADGDLKQTIRRRIYRPIDVREVVQLIQDFLEANDRHSKKKILVVDDSGVMLRSVKSWLEDKYQVILANSGAMAIKYLVTNQPDLILLDYEMPVVDGKQVLEMLRTESDFKNVPVIFLTSHSDKDIIMDIMALRPEGYLLKTLKPDEIKKAIDDFFLKKQMG